MLSVLRNLINFSKSELLENHVIYTINKDLVSDYHTEKLDGAISEQVFYYSPKWNFYHTCKRLSKLIKDEQAVLITNDWLELGMISHLGLQNPVVSILHGDFDYYYDLAKSHSNGIDKFICISPSIAQKLNTILPDRKNDITYKRFPVPEINFSAKENKVLRCIYYVRELKEERKQLTLLPEINQHLIVNKVNVFWTIAGGGLTNKEFEELWGKSRCGNVDFKGRLSNEAIIDELSANDIYILPSLLEGFPVALVEAMKAGVVPIITNWGGAVTELVIHNETGFYCNIKDAVGYAETIMQLNSNRKRLSQLSINAAEKAGVLFNPFSNTKEFENIFLAVFEKKRLKKKQVKVYGSRMDQPWIPNWITIAVRK